ncbi:STAS domain-containing protein [Methyloversatilis sp.]|uniref:STAS domain-containing protein n=1 Tax=Methyloversatilis sp. TaxID=2569862 RepID=UPI0035AE3988
MEIRTQLEESSARIVLAGRFEFSSHRSFREATEQILGRSAVEQLDVDLGAVSYLDSSALGMLLMLRDKAQSAGCVLRLASCSNAVKQVLDVANFQKLFTMV